MPLRRIDFSGYGASTFSEWLDQKVSGPEVTKVQFEASLGRTALDVIQVVSVIYPYCIQVVRTITMQRQNAGWVKRSDSGWQAASPGTFTFPAVVAGTYTGRVHLGTLNGAYNVRNIRDQCNISVDAPPSPSDKDPEAGRFSNSARCCSMPTWVGRKSQSHQRRISRRRIRAAPPDLPRSLPLSAICSLGPICILPSRTWRCWSQSGPLTPAISCTVEAGQLQRHGGHRAALLGVRSRRITQAGSGSGCRRPVASAARRAADPARRRLEHGTATLHRPGSFGIAERLSGSAGSAQHSNDFWYIADVADVLQLKQPAQLLRPAALHRHAKGAV